MADPVIFDIAPRAGLWTVNKGGEHVADYSHLDRATHEAVRQARLLEETGEPARVVVRAADGTVIEVDVGPEDVRPPGV